MNTFRRLRQEYRDRTELGLALRMFEWTMAAVAYMIISASLLSARGLDEGYLVTAVIFVPSLTLLGLGVWQSAAKSRR